MMLPLEDSAVAQPATTPSATSAHTGPVATAAQPHLISTILAVDPGNSESAYALISSLTRVPLEIGKVPNDQLLDILSGDEYGECAQHVAIEMVASYGMPVGREVFETCVWIGRFRQVIDNSSPWLPVDLIYRRDVKLHHCHTARAKDSNIIQALVDRFAPGQPNRGKGTKAQPGWFHGFAADVWQAYALAVYIADTLPGPPAARPEPHAGSGADAAATANVPPNAVAAAPSTVQEELL